MGAESLVAIKRMMNNKKEFMPDKSKQEAPADQAASVKQRAEAAAQAAKSPMDDVTDDDLELEYQRRKKKKEALTQSENKLGV